MNAGFVYKSIASGDCLVGLHGDMGDFAEQLAGRKNLLAHNSGGKGIAVGAHSHRHDDFFKSGVARALADAIDGALNLPGAGGNGSQRVGDGHTEIVVAMRRNHDFIDPSHSFA